MIKRCFNLALFVLFIFHNVKAQNTFSISGNVTDANTGEDLIGATIFIKEMSGKGTITNAYGFYSISIPAGKYSLVCQYIGYILQEKQVNLTSSQKVNFSLLEQITEMEEVIVSTRRKDENVTQVQMGIENISPKEIESVPVLFGEKDVLKTIQLMPGVKSSGEGSSGFNVRGGASDQNLILLDEATVYNASHLMGFFSVFNSDALKDVSMYKGTQPAEYGGRLSSVLDVKMNDGNNQKFGVSGGIGLISSRLTVEGPIVKNKGSFIVSGRRTYADMFLKLTEDFKDVGLYFYDLNAKANYRINDKNRVFLSGYFGKDVLGISSFGIDWGNSTGTLRWNHLFSDRLFSNTSFIFSNYAYDIHLDDGESLNMNIISRIQDYGVKQDFDLYLNNSRLKFGFNSTFHKIVPGAITSSSEELKMKDLTNKHSWENGLYISHQYNFTENLKAEYGTRFTIFSLLGPGDFYTYNNVGYILNAETYGSAEFVKTYYNLEPRASINFTINEKSSVKAAYIRNVQNLHLLSNSTSGNPTDLWIPSSNNVKPEIADQISLGYFRNFYDNKYEFSIETYYKNLQNQIDYKDGAELNYNDNVESEILFGSGRAYGLEFYLKKKYGKFNGWVSYTLSRTEHKFDEINNGKYYPARYDRTHDISIVGMYKINNRLSLSATWVYYTGNAVTFPSGKYEIDGKTILLYTERNAGRMPDYHRLDLGLTWIKKKTDKFESSWSFSIYNAYGRKNAYIISFRDNENDPTKTEAVQTTLFRFIPSFTYNFKF